MVLTQLFKYDLLWLQTYQAECYILNIFFFGKLISPYSLAPFQNVRQKL